MIGLEWAKAKVGSIGLSNHGRATLVVLAFVAAAGILFLWRATARAPADPEVADPITTPGQGTGPEAGPLVPPASSGADPGRNASDSAEPGLIIDRAVVSKDHPRFKGRGEIRGHVEVEGEAPFPDTWRLTVRPSGTLLGKELAEERVIEFTGGVQDFVVEDLPLAGYDVIADSDHLNGRIQPVLLERGSSSPFVVLRMIPAGFLEGSVQDAEGLPAAGVVLTLLHLDSTGDSQETSTDAAGRYRFEQVLDGAYQLLVGKEAAPLLRNRRTLRFQAPSMTLPPIELPPLSVLEFKVTDSDDRGVPDAKIRGSGNQGGAFEGLTGPFGELQMKHLLPGRYRIHVECEGYESYRLTIEVGEGEVKPVALRLWTPS